MLARMFQNGYPVPEGFVVLPQAFQEEQLTAEAWDKMQAYLYTIRKKYQAAQFAVRSSALSEDSADAVFRSRLSERGKGIQLIPRHQILPPDRGGSSAHGAARLA